MVADSSRIHTYFVVKETAKPERVIVWDTQEISLGRSPENDLSFDNSEISRKHVQFARTGKNCVVRNLSTANGTLVNGEAITTHELEARDEIRIADLELIFYQSTKDPVSLKMTIDYASQFKQFPGPSVSPADAEATMLGLLDTTTGNDEGFEVKPAGEFEYDLHGMDEVRVESSAPRDLDLELDGFGLDDLDISDEVVPPIAETAPHAAATPAPKAPAAPEPRASVIPEVWDLEDVGNPPAALSLQFEIEGLQGELHRALQGLIGKTIELPAMKIRIKGDDLG